MVQLYYSVLRQHCKDERLSSFFNGAEGDECKAVMYRLCAVYKTKAVELPKYEPMALYPQTVERNFYSTFRLILRFIYTLNSRQGGADKKLDRLREKAQLMPVLKRTHPA